jgi:hypothetical protein
MSQVITCVTLIDITATGVTKGQSDARDQQRNWESVLQVLGLKTQVHIVKEPVRWYDEDLKYLDFGEFYENSHTVWAFQFSGERDDYYTIEQLEQDFDQVPVVLGLDETARFMLPIFHSTGYLKNIYFINSPGLNII